MANTNSTEGIVIALPTAASVADLIRKGMDHE